jgi:hypothetical protein
MTRPRSDQEIEDRFVDVIVGTYDLSTVVSYSVDLAQAWMDSLVLLCRGSKMDTRMLGQQKDRGAKQANSGNSREYGE